MKLSRKRSKQDNKTQGGDIICPAGRTDITWRGILEIEFILRRGRT